METALITGGNGNLGNLVAERLLARGMRVVRFDVPGSAPAETRDNEIVVGGDIRDRALLSGMLEEHRPREIYHLASRLSGSSEADLAAAWEVNATASFHLLHAATAMGVGKVFYPSTAATYALVAENPMSNDHPQWPASLYGATKVAVERLGVYFKQVHGLDFRCLRFPMVISPSAPGAAVSAFPSHAIRAAHAGEDFSFPVSPDTGVSTIFIEDVIDAIVNHVAADPGSMTEHAYNLHGFYLSAAMVADAVSARYPGFNYRFEPVPAVQKLISDWPDVADDSAARRDWGWDPVFDLDRSLDRMRDLLAGA